MINTTIEKRSYIGIAAVISALYVAQGLPGGLIGHALPAILREQGVGLALIGMLKLLALPWLLKFIWAPFVDGNGAFSRRYRWILAMQICSACTLFIMSFMLARSIEQYLLFIGLALLMINLFSATQDIATDGFTASVTSKDKLGIANSIQVIGYKVGMIIGGSGLLYLSAFQPMPSLIRWIAVLLLLLLVPLIMFSRRGHSTDGKKEKECSEAMSFYETYKGLLRQPIFRYWLPVLLTYKVADALGSTMLKPLLVDSGFNLQDIGELTLYSSLVGLCGAALAGLVYKKIGQVSALFIFGLMQTLSIAVFYLVAEGIIGTDHLESLVMAEQFCDGLSTVVLFSAMMSLCRKGHEGADYTLQASIQIVLAGVVGALSGLIAQFLSYGSLYLVCALIGALSLWFVVTYGRFCSGQTSSE